MQAARVVEFYSGIGGMHFALEESGMPHDVVACIDINDVANSVYRHNFPTTRLLQRNIESLTVEEVDKLNADMFLMSPPCQPFTRVGLKGDTLDKRTRSFLYILDLIQKLEKKPSCLLIENVKGFESSDTRQHLVDMLCKTRYSYQEFLLSPLQFGIPNSRLRYYLVAIKPPLAFPFRVSEQVLSDFPVQQSAAPLEQTIENFLEKDQSKDYFEHFLLDPKLLNRYGTILDIVASKSKGSCCFTKAYSHYVQGTGSVLQMNEAISIDSVYAQFKTDDVDDPDKSVLSPLKLRFFTPKEVANLLSFPPRFSFPESTSNRQRYRLLGNSLNVHVVAQLLTLWNQARVE
ncbi:tRNA (cytosine(38)-C(5))-methyltransferase-like [Oscarella lobularis]|uniref:tRNA (cytosine(38)-C(5))-methyltransferase-like n=1 Tax=Oscarella lobularis TaxID=121494 RepID=UPI00331320FB